jgi:cell division septum initiation protein DivIVA
MILPQDSPSQRGSVSAFAERLVADIPPRLYLPEDQARPDAGDLVFRVGCRSEAERIAALVGPRDLGQAVDASTDHALLVLLGEYARQLGLIGRLQAVPIDQRQGDYSPQSKLIEFLVAILAGLEHLEDLNQAPDPLVKDQAVIASWGQTGFAHYSGVSRTLEVAGVDTLSAVMAVLETVSQPFIDAEVMALARRGQALALDVDLTGRKISSTSTTYEGAGFGYMDGEIANGFQAAITSLTGGPCGRLLLSSQRYAGPAQSAECLQAAVQKMEQVLGLHPRRRTEQVQQRLQTLATSQARLQASLDAERAHQRDLFDALQAARQEEARQQAEVERLSAEFQARGWVERPHSKLAQARQRVVSAQKRQRRAGRDLRATAARLTKWEHALADGQAQQTHLLDWLAQLEGDNATLLHPLSCILRVDAGFSTDDNLTWLIEMGYVVYTKAHNGQTTAKLLRQLPATVTWQRVGRNAEAVYVPQQRIAECPYDLEALLVRYHVPTGYLYTTLLYYGDRPPPQVLKDWFSGYNARQTIEAGIKEGKGVFRLRHPLVRSPFGMLLQEQFGLFAANFVRWAAHWAKQLVRQANHALTDALTEVKTLVQDVAHCRARLVHNAVGRVLVFDEHSPYAGVCLLLSGQATFQHVLPFFKSLSFAQAETT